MRILILSTSHPYKEAGIVAYDFYKSLKLLGNEVRILTLAYDNYKEKDIISIRSRQKEYLIKILKFPLRIIRKLFRDVLNYEFKEMPNSNYLVQEGNQTKTHYKTDYILKRSNFQPDAIIVYFMPYFLNFKNLYELNKITKAPILLYMMDMAPITGGCHYAWDCQGYMNSCGKCPALHSESENDQSRINWKYKKDYIDLTNIIIIAGTEYQYKQLQRASLFENKTKEKLLLGADPELFKISGKLEAREFFNIPQNKKIIFFGAMSHKEQRKGFKELVEALKMLNNDAPEISLHIVIAGKSDEKLIRKLPYEYTLLGYLNYQLLAKVFNASDVFLCPSIEDSGPMMINQSIMSGTPVVAFEMGVALDLVFTGKTGYRAKLKDSADFAKGIKYVLEMNDSGHAKMRENCRNLGLDLFHPQKQAQRFIEILNSNMKNENREIRVGY